MHLASIRNPLSSQKKRYSFFVFAALLIVLAFLANTLKVELLPGVRLFFGPVFVLLLAALYGPRWATLGALVAGLVPYGIWQNPSDILVFTLEGLCIALLYPRLRLLTLASLGFWALIGLPVFALTHLSDLHGTLGWVILLKVGTNGVFDALIADLALILLAQRFRLVSRPLGGLRMNQVLACMLLSATLLPATFLTFVQTRTTLRGIESQLIASLKAEAGKGALMMATILQRRFEILWGISHLAAEKGLSSSSLIENMALVQELSPEFYALLVLDQEGTVRACLSSHFDCSTRIKSRLFEENKLTGVVQNTGIPMLADDFQPGLPGLKSAPAMVVPILGNGEPLGVIVSILDLGQLRAALFRATSPNIEVRLVNARGKPVLGSPTFFNETLGHGRYSMRRMEDGLLYAMPADSVAPSATFVERWQQSFYLYSLPVGQTPWTIETRVPLGGSLNRLMYALLPSLATFWGLALLMLVLAWVAAKTLSRPLGRLEALASRVKDEPLTPIARTDWPDTFILEVNSLSVSLHMLLATLRDSLQALKGANETLEGEVVKRTAELRETIDRLKSEIEQRKRLEDLLERAQRIARIGSWERDLKTNEMVYSKETYKIYGLQEGESPSYERFMAVVHPEDRVLVNRVIDEAIQNHACLDFEYRIVRKNGEMRTIREQAEVVLDEQGKPVKFTGTNQDVTEKKRAELALAESEALLRTLLEAMPLAVGMKDAEGRWLLANPQTLRLFQLEGKEYVGKTDDELSQAIPELGETLAYCKVTDERTWKAGTLCLYEEKVEVKDGQSVLCEVTKIPLLNPDGSRKGLIFVGRDITEERLAQRRIEQMTYYDELTGLPNRMLLAERLQQAISHHPVVVVALIDLDRFKVLNESLGFEASNEIIRSVAKRLRLAIRSLDTVSRPWGNEFSIVMPDIVATEDLADVAGRLLRVFEQPFWVSGQEVFVTASLGLSMSPKDGTNTDTLLKNAEMAMYRAKERGGGTYAFYTAELDEKISDYLLMETSLRKALKRNEFSLHYQPQISLETGAIVGCEALLRWNSEELGSVSPVHFIPVAEHTGLILPIGEWVLKQAIRQLKGWRALGFERINVSVNLSARQFQDPELLSMVKRVLSEEGVPPERLELEVTESTAMLDIEQTIEILGEIKKMGVRIALDDFGMEYSSLNYLKRLPVDTIKIDQSFIRGGLEDPVNQAIVSAVIQIAGSLGLRVIAEGVETRDQLLFLHALRCYGIQGYIFSRPVPADQFLLLLAENKTLEITEEKSVGR